jgi:uncharacterized membrane protein (TIGR02234 family)
MTAERRPERRELGLVVIGCLAGAGLVLWAVGRTWLSLRLPRAAPLGTYVQGRSGSAVEPVVRGLALAALAGGVALFATRRLGRTIVGVLLALAGVGIVIGSLRYAGGVGQTRALALLQSNGGHVVGADAGTRVAVSARSGWIACSTAGGVLILLAGAVTALRAWRWPAMGAKYDAPADRAAQDAASATVSGAGSVTGDAAAAGVDPTRRDRATWDALDRGDDPTEPDPHGDSLVDLRTRQSPDTAPGGHPAVEPGER